MLIDRINAILTDQEPKGDLSTIHLEDLIKFGENKLLINNMRFALFWADNRQAIEVTDEGTKKRQRLSDSDEKDAKKAPANAIGGSESALNKVNFLIKSVLSMNQYLSGEESPSTSYIKSVSLN